MDLKKGYKMDKLLRWCIENYSWVFSGIGVFIVSLLFGWGFTSKKKKNQVIKGKSSGIQAGRDIIIKDNGTRK